MNRNTIMALCSALLVFFALSCAPLIGDAPKPVEPVAGEGRGLASVQFMNVMIHGDDIQSRVRDRYPNVAAFYGDGGSMLEGMAVANMYPPREIDPSLLFHSKIT